MDPRKRSHVVVLTLLGVSFGAVELAGAFPGHEMRRNLYPDRAACERDYSTAQCEPGTGNSAGHSSGFHGPYYYADRSLTTARSDPGSGRTGQVTASQTSIRGGFGSFGRAMHAVG